MPKVPESTTLLPLSAPAAIARTATQNATVQALPEFTALLLLPLPRAAAPLSRPPPEPPACRRSAHNNPLPYNASGGRHTIAGSGSQRRPGDARRPPARAATAVLPGRPERQCSRNHEASERCRGTRKCLHLKPLPPPSPPPPPAPAATPRFPVGETRFRRSRGKCQRSCAAAGLLSDHPDQ